MVSKFLVFYIPDGSPQIAVYETDAKDIKSEAGYLMVNYRLPFNNPPLSVSEWLDQAAIGDHCYVSGVERYIVRKF